MKQNYGMKILSKIHEDIDFNFDKDFVRRRQGRPNMDVFNLKNSLTLINCSKDFKNEAVQTLSKRLGIPLYIPLISILTSFLLISKKEKAYNFLKKYMLFILSFLILIFAEIFLKYTGLSTIMAMTYFIIPVSATICFYIYLFRNIMTEKNSK